MQLRDGSTHLGTVPSMEPNEDTVTFSQVSSCCTRAMAWLQAYVKTIVQWDSSGKQAASGRACCIGDTNACFRSMPTALVLGILAKTWQQNMLHWGHPCLLSGLCQDRFSLDPGRWQSTAKTDPVCNDVSITGH